MKHRITEVNPYGINYTDMIMIDPETKEFSEDGQPYEIETIDRGDKWLKITIKEPIGRKTRFRTELHNRVHVLRGVNEMTDVYAKIRSDAVDNALHAQRRAEEARDAVAKAATDTGEFKAPRYSWRNEHPKFSRPSADEILRSAQTAAERAEEARLWANVQHVWLNNDDAPEVHDAVAMVADRIREDLIWDRIRDDISREAARRFVQHYGRFGDLTEMAQRMNVPEEWQ